MKEASAGLAVTLLLGSLVLTAGCMGGSDAPPASGGEGSTESLIYPGASRVDVPDRTKEHLNSALSSDVSVDVYSADDDPSEVEEWYVTRLRGAGWSRELISPPASLWRNGDKGIQLIVDSASSPGVGSTFGVNGSEDTVVVMIRGPWEDMSNISPHSRGG